MHEDLIGRLTFALEKQKAGAFSYLFSEAIAALSARPDAGSGDDARAQVADGMLPPLPIAFFDEFGRGVDDRVQDYARSALAARQPVRQGRVEELRDALGKVRLRCMFIGWPAESMWEATPGNWIPDWRYELQLMEHVLHGSEIRTPEKPTDTVPRNQLPQLVPDEPVAKVRQDGGYGPVVWYYPHTFYGTKIPDGADLFLGPPAPAAVPVDVLREAAALADAVEKNGEWDDGCFYYNKHAASELQIPLVNLRRALATHPQPAAARHHFQDRLAEIQGRPRAEPEPPHDACACCYSNDCNGECMENL
ncbi:hypothetical protein [Xanthomonas arboricola]|uniref:hypothetical protein n=1 Tax=Xanthomonas arboricola TaxID=56448 RepID=UPI001614E30E|nr:hypothetical protein [Xanthomonas arboricola]MBB5675567.1 hypothetical protein [Xanthomonas arboricola]